MCSSIYPFKSVTTRRQKQVSSIKRADSSMSMHICAHLLHSWSHTDLCNNPLTLTLIRSLKTAFSPSKHRSFKNRFKKKQKSSQNNALYGYECCKQVCYHAQQKQSAMVNSWWVLHRWTQRGCLEINWFCTHLRCAQSFPAIVSKSSLQDLGTNKQQKTLKSIPPPT